MRRCPAAAVLVVMIVALGAPCLAAAAGAAARPTVTAGEEGGQVWILVPAAGSDGFRMVTGDRGKGGCRLVFPGGIGVEAGTVSSGLKSLPSLTLVATEEGKGMALLLPFPPGSLTGVDRRPDGWRFVFTPPPADTEIADLAAEPLAYRIGVRDVLEVSVFAHEDLTGMSTVPPDGVLHFPMIGAITVAGRTVSEVEAELAQRLGADFLVDPQVSVRVKEYESQWVNIVGEVKTPGRYPLKGAVTLVDVLTQAGGLTEHAGNEITLTRLEPDVPGGARRVTIAREDLFSPDNRRVNVPVRHQDVISVSEQEMFYIQGEVGRPGSYPLERGYTVLKAVSIAGGFSQWADQKEVELLRDEGGERHKMVLNLKAIAERKKPDVELLPEDILIVKRRVL
jgi:polysaccharide export outer membrane protein